MGMPCGAILFSARAASTNIMQAFLAGGAEELVRMGDVVGFFCDACSMKRAQATPVPRTQPQRRAAAGHSFLALYPARKLSPRQVAARGAKGGAKGSDKTQHGRQRQCGTLSVVWL